MGVIRAAGEELLEGILILLASHECWRETLHEDLRELTVTGVDDTFELSVVLLEVGCNEVWLAVALPEALDLQTRFHE